VRGQEVRSSSRFFLLGGSIECVEVETQLLDDLCSCVDVWRQQPINLLFLLWLCQCLKFFLLCGCVDMGKNQQRCDNC
jgi:hypothetical protein